MQDMAVLVTFKMQLLVARQQHLLRFRLLA
jgi:hypothetical protein